MGDIFKKRLNRDKMVFYEEAPHRPLRDGLIDILDVLYGVFVPGSLLKEHKNSPHIHKDKSNLYCAWAGEIIRSGVYGIGVYFLFLKEVLGEYSQY